MKIIAFLIILLCSLSSCKKEDSIPTQLLVNSDLESVIMSVWLNYGTSFGFTAYRTNEDSFSPTYSLKLARTTVDTARIGYWVQTYSGKMPIGHDLTLTAKIKGVNLVGSGISIAIRCDGVDPNLQFATTQNITSITGSFPWTTYSVDLPDLESGVKSIIVYLIYLPKTTGSAFFDDITLTHK